jgi:DNA-directed RNA polymerase specialized sigma24 family protein
VVVEDVQKEPQLSELSTQWTMLFQAHHGTPEQVSDALRLMMLRYSGAVHRYLLKTVGDPDEAQELDQEFALRFLKGSFLKYDPNVGRFRDYVKGAVRNLMIDYHRRKGKTRRLDTEMEMAVVGASGQIGRAHV